MSSPARMKVMVGSIGSMVSGHLSTCREEVLNKAERANAKGLSLSLRRNTNDKNSHSQANHRPDKP